MDKIDRQILDQLQKDATMPMADLGERAGLSTSSCWRRVQILEESGVIRGRVALLDRDKINVGVTVFVAIRTNRHTAEWLARFARVVARIPEIVEAYRMSGEVDYLLKLVVPDIAAYDRVYKRLIEDIELFDVSSSFAMEQMKFTTAMPLNYV